MVGKLTSDTMLSCSRLPAILGVSPYATANDELRRTVDALAGIPREYEPSEPADWGNTFEPFILNEIGKRLGMPVLFPTVAYYAPDVPLAASVDGVGMPSGALTISTNVARGIYVVGGDTIKIAGPGVFEAKLTADRPERNDELDEPVDHRGPIQLQGGMICTGFKWGAVGVLYGGTQLRIYVYRPDPDMQRKIIEAAHDFERRKIGPDWYPPVSGVDAARLWPTIADDDLPVELPAELLPVVEGVYRGKASIKKLESANDEANAVLMQALGNHKSGVITAEDGTRYKVTWPVRRYKAQPAKTVPAKAAYEIRQATVSITVMSDES